MNMLGVRSLNSVKTLKKDKQPFRPFRYFCYDFVKITGVIPTLIWMRPKIHYPFGRPKKSGAIMVSANHRSFLDPVVVELVFPFRRLSCLATKDLFNSKLKIWFFTQMQCIVVDKANFSLASFHEVVNRLNRGKVVVIYPEGGVNTGSDDSIRAFKSGAILMAHKAKAPILPIYIVKREKWYQRQHIIVGDRFDVSGCIGNIPTVNDFTKASEILREKEIELQQYYENYRSN